MRLRLLAWLPGLTLAAMLIAPTAASATQTETVHVGDTFSLYPAVDPCSGAIGTLTITFQGVIHLTQQDSGAFHVANMATGTSTFIPDDPNLPTYTGHTTTMAVRNDVIVNHAITSPFNMVLHGSDGSLIREHAIFHLTVHADGTVSAFVNVDELVCP